jgi:hypothetical protein
MALQKTEATVTIKRIFGNRKNEESVANGDEIIDDKMVVDCLIKLIYSLIFMIFIQHFANIELSICNILIITKIINI